MSSEREIFTPPSDAELQADVAAYVDAGGNKSLAARARDMPRKTFCNRLTQAEKRFGIILGEVAGGSLEEQPREVRAVPGKGKVKRYILTSIQNNTHLHPGWVNLKAYADYLNAEFIIGTYSYALDAYGAKSVKRGSWKPQDKLWYVPEVRQFINDSRIELAPNLLWCGEMNVIPTAAHPLTGLEQYNGRASNIIPHAKIEMASIPALQGEGAKLNFSTGTITQRNYIQKRAGILAESAHSYGGLLVEVDSAGDWFVRQLHLDALGYLCDIGPHPAGPVEVACGAVTQVDCVGAITWADIHSAEIAPWVSKLAFGRGGMLDTLRPKVQFMHDVFSMRARGHHEIKDFHASYAKFSAGLESVEDEIKLTARLLNKASRAWCETLVVPSNHDRHLTRWLNEADPKKDLVNAKYFTMLQYALLALIDNEKSPDSILEIALRRAGLRDRVRMLPADKSFTICGDLECSMHGDRGPNGARGSTRNLARLGRKVNKGHDHAAAISGGVYSTGACAENFDYAKGPTSHSVSHIVTFANGTRQIVTMWKGKWGAR